MALVGLVSMVVACSSASPTDSTVPPTSAVPESPFFDGETSSLFVDGETLFVAVADTSSERSRGLMGIENLAGLDGMLFIHDEVGIVSYTMRDTLIPLDIWFIDEGDVIVGTAEMEPCDIEPCISYASSLPVLRVLETPLGEFEFAIGSVVSTAGSD